MWFWMGNLYKNVQLMLQILKGSFLVLHFCSYILMTFVMMLSVILLFMLMIYTALYSTCDQVSDLWQQLELASELESDLRDTVGWGRKLLVDFNAGEKNLKKFMSPFHGWGSTPSRLEPLRRDNLLFTTKFPEIPGAHFIDLGRKKTRLFLFD